MASPTNRLMNRSDFPDSRLYNMKIVMLGDGAVGKTSLILRYTNNTFNPEYKRSIGANFALKKIQLENHELSLLIWDIAGQPTYHDVRRHYYTGAHGALLVFDVTNPSSFMTLNNWSENFKEISPSGHLILVANKIDLSTERRVNPEVTKMLTDWWKIPSIETSCLTGANVSEAFTSLASRILKTMIQEENSRDL